jgi:CRP-like cAMP-binding protein
MISPEVLRHYQFFGSLDDSQLDKVAMICNELIFESGEVIFNEGEPAKTFYFLLDGSVDLYYTVEGIKHPDLGKGIPVGEINPGEPFGISALIEPYKLTSTARAFIPCRAISIEAKALQDLFVMDRRMAYLFTHQVAKAAIDRLHATRVQLAAAWV